MTAGVESGGFLCRFRSQLFFYPERPPGTDLELKRALVTHTDKLGFKY